MVIKRLIGGSLESNGYIIYEKNGKSCYIIDPGYNGERFIVEAEKLNLKIDGILLTHSHYDHIGGVKKIKATISCPVYIHRGEFEIYNGPADVILDGGETIALGGEEIEVIHTPGHTAGCVCYYSSKSKLVFTGDTIFNVDLGRTDLETGSESEMIYSIKNIIDTWSNEIVIYPGHGDHCNMKYVREHNSEYLDIMKS